MRRWFLLVLLCFIDCVGCSPAMHKAYRASVTAIAAGEYIVDARQTHRGLNTGAIPEANPLMRPLWGDRPGALRTVGVATGAIGLIVTGNRLVERLPVHDQFGELLKDVIVTLPMVAESMAITMNASTIGESPWH